MTPNPYAPPEAPVADRPEAPGPNDIVRLNRIAAAQRLLTIAVLISIVSLLFDGRGAGIGVLVGLVTGIVSIVGTVRLSGALGSPMWVRVACAILMIVPLVNLVTMLLLSARATRRLRAAGYRVGLMGASQRPVEG